MSEKIRLVFEFDPSTMSADEVERRTRLSVGALTKATKVYIERPGSLLVLKERKDPEETQFLRATEGLNSQTSAVVHDSVMRVVRAWKVYGPVPELHIRSQEALRQSWPTLARAVEELASLFGVPQ